MAEHLYSVYDKNTLIKSLIVPETVRQQYLHQNNRKKLCKDCKNSKIIQKNLDINNAHEYDHICSICSAILDSYAKSVGFKTLKYFRQHNNLTILDIGCGLGLLDVLLAAEFPNFTFILLDRKDGTRTAKAGFNENPNDFGTRTDVSLSQKWHQQNFPLVKNITYVDTSEINKLGLYNIDVIMSSTSWCFHYPFEVYSNLITEHDVKYIIVNLRHDTDANKFTLLNYTSNKYNTYYIFDKKN